MIEAKNIRVEVGEIPKNKKQGVIYFKNFDEMNKVLNSRRIGLLSIIKEKQPESIYGLAKLTKYDQGNITKDVNILNKCGFLHIKKQKEGERIKSKPEYSAEGINMLIKMSAGAFGIAKEVLDNVKEEFKDKNLEENKKYASKQLKKAIKPVKEVVKKVAKEFDIVVKD